MGTGAFNFLIILLFSSFTTTTTVGVAAQALRRNGARFEGLHVWNHLSCSTAVEQARPQLNFLPPGDLTRILREAGLPTVRLFSFSPGILGRPSNVVGEFDVLMVSERDLADLQTADGSETLSWPGYVVVYQSAGFVPAAGTAFEIDATKGILYCNDRADSAYVRVNTPHLVLSRNQDGATLLAASCDQTCQSNMTLDTLARARAWLDQVWP